MTTMDELAYSQSSCLSPLSRIVPLKTYNHWITWLKGGEGDYGLRLFESFRIGIQPNYQLKKLLSKQI